MVMKTVKGFWRYYKLSHRPYIQTSYHSSAVTKGIDIMRFAYTKMLYEPLDLSVCMPILPIAGSIGTKKMVL